MADLSMNINSLPNEVLLKIFWYVSAEDLGVRVQFVCSRWAELCSDRVLWKNSLFCPEKNSSFHYISGVLEKVPNLQCFQMTVSSAEILHKLSDCCKDLRKLVVSDISQVERIGEALGKLVLECRNLEELTLPVGVLINETLAALVGQCRSLRAITLTKSSQQPVILKYIADGCPYLQSVHMGCVDWLYSDLRYLLQKKKNTLLSLRLIPFSSEGFCVFSLLSMFESNLPQLQLAEGLYVHEYSDWSTFSLIKSLPSLTELKITAPVDLTADIMLSTFMDEGMSKLLELEIVYCLDLNASVVDTICNNCKNLVKLGLPYCKNFTDDGLRNLFKCPSLEELDLSHCESLTNAAVDSIIKCSNLKYLKIGHSGIKKGRLTLIRYLPELRELDLFGYNTRGLPSHIFPKYLKKVRKLIIECQNSQRRIHFDALAALYEDWPYLKVPHQDSYFYIDN